MLLKERERLGGDFSWHHISAVPTDEHLLGIHIPGRPCIMPRHTKRPSRCRTPSRTYPCRYRQLELAKQACLRSTCQRSKIRRFELPMPGCNTSLTSIDRQCILHHFLRHCCNSQFVTCCPSANSLPRYTFCFRSLRYLEWRRCIRYVFPL